MSQEYESNITEQVFDTCKELYNIIIPDDISKLVASLSTLKIDTEILNCELEGN